MILRTASAKGQWLAWSIAAGVCAVLYLVCVFVLDDGTAWWAFWRAVRMRYFLPFAALFGFVAYELRFDWAAAMKTELAAEFPLPTGGALQTETSAQRSIGVSVMDEDFVRRLQRLVDERIAARQASRGDVSTVLPRSDGREVFRSVADDERAFTGKRDSEVLWARAESIPHDYVPNPDADAEHLALVFSAAREGHIQALSRLGEYAFLRSAFVEAYFWTKAARCRCELLNAESPGEINALEDFLREIRNAWLTNGRPEEEDNVYGEFTSLRGSLARALLNYDTGTDRAGSATFIRQLADSGNADAVLFVNRQTH